MAACVADSAVPLRREQRVYTLAEHDAARSWERCAFCLRLRLEGGDTRRAPVNVPVRCTYA